MTVVAFLRAMNVGGRRISNPELISVFTNAGYSDVAAYQASGNVIFGSLGAADADASALSAVLAEALGYDVDVFVRTDDHLATICSISPIAARVGAGGGKPQIVFLRSAHGRDLASVFPDDHEVHLVGSEIHWLPPAGLGELGNLHKAMDRTLGPTTVRTLGTIQRLARRLE